MLVVMPHLCIAIKLLSDNKLLGKVKFIHRLKKEKERSEGKWEKGRAEKRGKKRGM